MLDAVYQSMVLFAIPYFVSILFRVLFLHNDNREACVAVICLHCLLWLTTYCVFSVTEPIFTPGYVLLFVACLHNYPTYIVVSS